MRNTFSLVSKISNNATMQLRVDKKELIITKPNHTSVSNDGDEYHPTAAIKITDELDDILRSVCAQQCARKCHYGDDPVVIDDVPAILQYGKYDYYRGSVSAVFTYSEAIGSWTIRIDLPKYKADRYGSHYIEMAFPSVDERFLTEVEYKNLLLGLSVIKDLK